MVLKRLAPTPLSFHNAGALSRVVQGPIEYTILKEVIEQVLESIGEGVTSPSGIEKANAVEDFPDRNGCETNPLVGDPIQKRSDPRFRMRAHHF